jgi:hypothetical protein
VVVFSGRLLLAAVVDYVPADHLAQFVVALAREHLDLSEIVASYKSGLGQPPFARPLELPEPGRVVGPQKVAQRFDRLSSGGSELLPIAAAPSCLLR